MSGSGFPDAHCRDYVSPARELVGDRLRGSVGGEQGAFLPAGQRRHLVAGEMERAVAPAQHRRRVGIAARPSALLEGNIEPATRALESA